MAFALGIPAAVTAGLDAVGKVATALDPLINRFFPDPQKALEFRNEMMKTLVTSDVAQLEVNKAEAASGSLFVAGWRPFIGWICGFALVYEFLLRPLLPWIAIQTGFAVADLPSVTLSGQLWELMFGMLGMGALRSFDKYQGTGAVQVGGTSPSVKLGKSLEGAR